MVVEKILKELTPERRKKEIEEVQNIKLPAELQRWVDEYERVGERDGFIWKWLYKLYKTLTLCHVKTEYCESLTRLKTLYSMYFCQFNDVANKPKCQKLLNELLKIPFDIKHIKFKNLRVQEREYLFFTKKLWCHIQKTIRKYPNFKIMEDFFNFDNLQFLNTEKYLNFLSKHQYNIINSTEYWLYLSYGMQVMINFDLDLMCCQKLNLDNLNNTHELGNAREAILCLQEMARLGNWITTWKREVKSNDFTSIVIPYALDKKIIHLKMLLQPHNQNKEKIIRKIEKAQIKNYFLKKEWEVRYKKLNELCKKTTLINNESILKKARNIITMHLISEGFK